MMMIRSILLLIFLLPVIISYAEEEKHYLDPVAFAANHTLDKSTQYAKQMCALPNFKCIKVRPGQTWSSLFPDFETREAIMRLNRTNVSLSYRSWLIVPSDYRAGQRIDYMMLSPLPLKREPLGRNLIFVDLNHFAFGAYNPKGELIYWGPVSGGKAYCDVAGQDCYSALGHYRITRYQGANCISHTYPLEVKGGGAPMPYCMFYHNIISLNDMIIL